MYSFFMQKCIKSFRCKQRSSEIFFIISKTSSSKGIIEYYPKNIKEKEAPNLVERLLFLFTSTLSILTEWQTEICSYVRFSELTVNLLHVCDEFENLVRVTDLIVIP